jgi:hypothetical protein
MFAVTAADSINVIEPVFELISVEKVAVALAE